MANVAPFPDQHLLFQSSLAHVTPERVSGAISALDTFYNSTSGRYGDAWWFTAIATHLLITYAATIPQSDQAQYLMRAAEIVDLNKGVLPWWPSGGGAFRADSTDDTGWWALVLLDLWDATGRVRDEYVQMAVLDEAYMWEYWSGIPCGGGIWWDAKELAYKNAISNGLYVKLAAKLHNLGVVADEQEGDKNVDYLGRARKAWNWIRNSGMINQDGLLNDGVDEVPNSPDRACVNNGQPTWTYNQGVAIGALLELHRADSSAGYLRDASAIADAVLASDLVSPGGVLVEPCDRDCLDQEQFKGIFVRELVGLAEALEGGDGEKYWEFILSNAETTIKKSRYGNFYGYLWQGPFGNSSVASQTSAASLLVAAASAKAPEKRLGLLEKISGSTVSFSNA